MAFFLAYAINPLVEFLQKKGARREYAILTVYVILIVLIVRVTIRVVALVEAVAVVALEALLHLRLGAGVGADVTGAEPFVDPEGGGAHASPPVRAT